MCINIMLENNSIKSVILKYLDILRLETNEGGRELLDNVSPEEMYEICSALHSKC